MQKLSLKKMVLSFAALAGLSFGGNAAAAVTLEDIFAISADGNRIGQASQVRIDQLADETSTLLDDYSKILKEIEGLRVYNAQLDRQISNQEKEMAELTASIEEVTLIERQITPLMIRMIATLDEFISHDMPFLMGERTDRVMRLNEIMDQADISPSEKFRVVFEAYQIENDYGRTIEAYEDTLEVQGSVRDVFILRIGRVGLYYQTKDGSISGMYNNSTRSWVLLDDDYAAPISMGIRIANNQTSPNLINLPMIAPE